jgi:hypothetical protein
MANILKIKDDILNIVKDLKHCVVDCTDIFDDEKETIKKNPKFELCQNLHDKKIILYHKFLGEVLCYVFFNIEIKAYKVSSTGKITRHKFSNENLFFDKGMKDSFLEKCGGNQFEFITERQICPEKLKTRTIVFENRKKLNEELKNILENNYKTIDYYFSNGHCVNLVFRSFSLNNDELNIEYSDPKSPYRTQRVFSFNVSEI